MDGMKAKCWVTLVILIITPLWNAWGGDGGLAEEFQVETNVLADNAVSISTDEADIVTSDGDKTDLWRFFIKNDNDIPVYAHISCPDSGGDKTEAGYCVARERTGSTLLVSITNCDTDHTLKSDYMVVTVPEKSTHSCQMKVAEDILKNKPYGYYTVTLSLDNYDV